jgi:hypothetical protein
VKRTIPAGIQATVDQITARNRARFGHGVYRMADEGSDEGDANAEVDAPAALPTADELAGMTPEEVQAALDGAHEEAASIRETDPADMSDDQVDRLEALAAFATAVTADTARRTEEAAARAERVNAASEVLDADADGGDGEPGEGDAGEGDGAGDEGAGDEGEGDGDAAPASVAAAAVPVQRPVRQPSRIRQIARTRTPDPRPASQASPLLSLVAAADVGDGISAGADLQDMGGLTRAFIARSRAFSGMKSGPRSQLNVATISRNFEATPDGLYQDNPDYEDDYQVLVAAANESRLPGSSLVASIAARERALVAGGDPNSLTAAGWCAPSTTLYGLCAAETLDGIIDVPEVGVTRGGLNFTEGPDFVDIYTSAGFAQTEAEAIAGETKDCVEITCPDFDEVRLDAVGICVRAPLLTRAAYPELIERWVSGTVVANQHKVGARIVAGMSTLLGASASWVLTGTPITWGLLTALEFTAEQERTKRRLSQSESMEVVLPHWAPLALRADLANRNGIDERSVSRAQIMEHFTDRMLAPQFVYGLQDLDPAAVAFPATITGLIYPAGTFVKGTEDVITLDTVYDNPSLVTNKYTAAFVEDGVLVAKMCPGGRKVTVPALATGQLGAANLNDPWGTAQVA